VESKSEELAAFCAYLLLDEKAKAGELLEKIVKKDRTMAYEFKEWAIFDIPSHRVWLTETLRSRGFVSDINFAEPKKLAS
jgi:hypothetical protein